MAVPPVRATTSSYAVCRSSWAVATTSSAMWVSPVTMPGGNPASVPVTPRSSASTVPAPVLVMLGPASTENPAAVPRSTAAVGGGGNASAGDSPARGVRTSSAHAPSATRTLPDLATLWRKDRARLITWRLRLRH